MNRLNAFVIAFAILLVGNMATTQQMSLSVPPTITGAKLFSSTLTTDGDARFRADTYIGTANTDSMVVAAKTVFNSRVAIGDVTGDGDSLIVRNAQYNYGTVRFGGVGIAGNNWTVNGTFQTNGTSYINGSATNLGNTVTDVITVIGKFALGGSPSASPVARQIYASGDTLYLRNAANSAWLQVYPAP